MSIFYIDFIFLGHLITEVLTLRRSRLVVSLSLSPVGVGITRGKVDYQEDQQQETHWGP